MTAAPIGIPARFTELSSATVAAGGPAGVAGMDPSPIWAAPTRPRRCVRRRTRGAGMMYGLAMWCSSFLTNSNKTFRP
jgi:hypothetical protein